MFCKNCGELNTDSSKNCKRCGLALNADEKPVIAEVKPTSPVVDTAMNAVQEKLKGQNTKWIVLGLIVVFVVFGALGLSKFMGSSSVERTSNYKFIFSFNKGDRDNYDYSLVKKDKILGNLRSADSFQFYGSFLGTNSSIYTIGNEKIEKLELNVSSGIRLVPIYSNNKTIYFYKDDDLYFYDVAQKEKERIAKDVSSVYGSSNAEVIVYSKDDRAIWKKGDREEILPKHINILAVKDNGDVYYTSRGGNTLEFSVWKNGETKLIHEFDSDYALDVVSSKNFNEALIKNGPVLYLYEKGKVTTMTEIIDGSSSDMYVVFNKFNYYENHDYNNHFVLHAKDTIRDMVLYTGDTVFYIDKNLNLNILSDAESKVWRYGDYVYGKGDGYQLTQFNLKTGKKTQIATSDNTIEDLYASMDGKVIYYVATNEVFIKEAGKEEKSVGFLGNNNSFALNTKGEAIYINDDDELYYVNRGGKINMVKKVEDPLRVLFYTYDGEEYFYVSLEGEELFSKDGRNFKKMDDSKSIKIY